MNPCSVILNVHETFECELRTLMIRERAVLARLKQVMPVKVALQRVLAAEGVLWHWMMAELRFCLLSGPVTIVRSGNID